MTHDMTHDTAGKVHSDDGTAIAFECRGEGPPLVLVDPAGGYRGFDTIRGLRPRLADDFTVYTYDRRGRGASTDTPPYAIAREVEDLAAIVAEAGGHAGVYGFSSGALLACHAAAGGVPIDGLVLLEPPFPTTGGLDADEHLGAEVAALVADDRRDEAVEHWLTSIGVPAQILAQMEPVLPAIAAVAHTLAYDAAITTAPLTDVLPLAVAPTLVLDSAGSDPALSAAAAGLARALPDATHRTLPGDWHGVDDEVLAPAIRAFLRDQPGVAVARPHRAAAAGDRSTLASSRRPQGHLRGVPDGHVSRPPSSS
jgi:pimeloyl-ACP methyl ester carboxylesterase